MVNIRALYLIPLLMLMFFFFPKKGDTFYSETKQHLLIFENNKNVLNDFYIIGSYYEEPSLISADQGICEEDEAQEVKEIWYTTKEGDSVASISKQFKQSVEVIKYNNPILVKKPMLQRGQKILLLSDNGIFHKVRRKENLSKIAKKYKVALENIIMSNDLRQDTIVVGQRIFIPNPSLRLPSQPVIRAPVANYVLNEKFLWPIKWKGVRSPFGSRIHPISKKIQFHKGVDLRASTGTRMLSPMNGTVIHAAPKGGWGKFIVIKHDNGFMTRYAHLSKIGVKKGDRVARGQKLGETGGTGYATAPHLHFEVINEKGEWVNPERMRRR